MKGIVEHIDPIYLFGIVFLVIYFLGRLIKEHGIFGALFTLIKISLIPVLLATVGVVWAEYDLKKEKNQKN